MGEGGRVALLSAAARKAFGDPDPGGVFLVTRVSLAGDNHYKITGDFFLGKAAAESISAVVRSSPASPPIGGRPAAEG